MTLRYLSTSIRRCIQSGELKAERATGPDGRTGWLVAMPEEGWTSAATAQEQARSFTPWWWENRERSGKIHYVQDLYTSSFEEVVPHFLCGYEGANIWSAMNLTAELLCPDCLREVEMRGLPPSLYYGMSRA